ncbi:uncharacterized protein LOC111066554 [Drosophila obscura]|uniref:uncharacterized protein LOC111066554 n=1 Tax=Drosophila obscura TaxID=7282 RepID=UPI001BB27F68|nr:uncharacterized protein LOC111066554 [Drosophila obscura]XP_041452377.1 uncharacterized protein LOC111066554 [Drosophila obscura]
MFLNEIGQPHILDAQKKYGPYDQHNGALLMTSTAFKDHQVSPTWCKRIIGSLENMRRLESVPNNIKNYTYHVIRPNEPTKVFYDETKLTVELLPTGKNKDGIDMSMFFIDNGQTRYLIVDELSGHLDFLIKASALKEDIDVVYIDELLLEEEQPINEDLYAFVQLIRPKHVYGIRTQEPLPKWLQDLCVNKDIYARVPPV